MREADKVVALMALFDKLEAGWRRRLQREIQVRHRLLGVLKSLRRALERVEGRHR